MTDSFYVPLGDDRWRATAHTTGPWDARAQHGGPPCALLGRAVQRCSPRDDMLVARFTGELLGPVPVGEVRVRARVARARRRVGRRIPVINPELTVHLRRDAVGEWIFLDAQTTISAGGAGSATSVVSDRGGPVGIAAQSLLVAARR